MSDKKPTAKKVLTDDELIARLMGEQEYTSYMANKALLSELTEAQAGEPKSKEHTMYLIAKANQHVTQSRAKHAESYRQEDDKARTDLESYQAKQRSEMGVMKSEMIEESDEERRRRLQLARDAKDAEYQQRRQHEIASQEATGAKTSSARTSSAITSSSHLRPVVRESQREMELSKEIQRKHTEKRETIKQHRAAQKQPDISVLQRELEQARAHIASLEHRELIDSEPSKLQHPWPPENQLSFSSRVGARPAVTGVSASRLDQLPEHNMEMGTAELLHALEQQLSTHIHAMRQLEENRQALITNIDQRDAQRDAMSKAQRGEYSEQRNIMMDNMVRISEELRKHKALADAITEEINQTKGNISSQGGGAPHDRIWNRIRATQIEEAVAAAALLAGPTAAARVTLLDKQTKLQLERATLLSQLRSLEKTRNFRNILPSYKINDLFEEYDEAIKALGASPPGGPPAGVPLRGRLVYDLDRVKELMLDEDDYMTLLFAFSEKGINIDRALPAMPPIVKSQLTIRPDPKTGILSVVFNNTDYPQPNPAGLPNERKAFSAQYNRVANANTCGGFGDDDAFADNNCLEILRKCLAGDSNSIATCKNLFMNRSRWDTLMKVDITNSNLYVLHKFLKSIGYPFSSTNHKEFDTNINNWYSTVNKKYSTSSTELDAIKQNTQLTTAIAAMVKQHNLYMNDINKFNNKTKQISHMTSYRGGVNNFSKINNLILSGGDGYFKTEGDVTVATLRKLVKDTQNVSFVADTFKKLFENLEIRMNKNGLNLDTNLENELAIHLAEFAATEKKLNKLLVLFSNFLWAFTTHGDSGSDEAQNKQDKADLTPNLTSENMQTYIDARDKIIKSLQKKQKQMIITFSPLFNISYPQ